MNVKVLSFKTVLQNELFIINFQDVLYRLIRFDVHKKKEWKAFNDKFINNWRVCQIRWRSVSSFNYFIGLEGLPMLLFVVEMKRDQVTSTNFIYTKYTKPFLIEEGKKI